MIKLNSKIDCLALFSSATKTLMTDQVLLNWFYILHYEYYSNQSTCISEMFLIFIFQQGIFKVWLL